MSRAIVVGSINRDATVTVDRFPNLGETLSDISLIYGLGGKDTNQAVAAAHSGVPIFSMGAVSVNPPGQRPRTGLVSRGVDVTHLCEVDKPSGTALTTVNPSGENTIALDVEVNVTVAVGPAKASLLPAPVGTVVLQVEIPAEVNAKTLVWTHSFGAHILLNLALARPTDVTFMVRVDILIINETEAGLTLGMSAPADPTEAIGVAWALQGLGPKHVMVTLGTDGVARTPGNETGHLPALTLGEAVDTAGIGDACVGALAAAMTFDRPLAETAVDDTRAGPTAILAPGTALSYATLPRVMHA